jgi:hypothetical protein
MTTLEEERTRLEVVEGIVEARKYQGPASFWWRREWRGASAVGARCGEEGKLMCPRVGG